MVISDYRDPIFYLKSGTAVRSTSATKMNRTSSRSHSVMTVHVTQNVRSDSRNTLLRVITAKLAFVDLAGSELVGKSFLEGKQLEEAKMINKSLSALGLVISSLTSKSAGTVHIPYRNSKLTRLLQDSLGGTSKMSLIMNISPSAINANETLSTLRFGLRAKYIQNKIIKNIEIINTSTTNNSNNNSPYGSPRSRNSCHDRNTSGLFNETPQMAISSPSFLSPRRTSREGPGANSRISSDSGSGSGNFSHDGPRTKTESGTNNYMLDAMQPVTPGGTGTGTSGSAIEASLREAVSRLDAQSLEIISLNAKLESIQSSQNFRNNF